MKKTINKESKMYATIGGVVLSTLAAQLAALFLMFQVMVRSASKENKKLSRELKNILKDGKDWKVMVTKNRNPSAFCMVKPYVFISIGLIKMLTPRETTAIILHEAAHISNKDLWFDLIAKNSISAIILSVVAAASGPIALSLTMFLYYILDGDKIVDKIFARTVERFEEKRADSFPVKYGYADDMISALQKLNKWITKMLANQPCGKICKIKRKLEDIFDEHPPVKQRIADILKAKETWAGLPNKSFINMRNMFMKKLEVKKAA